VIRSFSSPVVDHRLAGNKLAEVQDSPLRLDGLLILVVIASVLMTAFTVPLKLRQLEIDGNLLLSTAITLFGIGRFAQCIRVGGLAKPTLLSVATGTFVLSIVVANVVHPHPSTANFILIALTSITVVTAMKRAIQVNMGQCLTRAVFLFTALQTVVAMLQIHKNGTVTGGLFDESEQGFRRVGRVLSPSGTLGHANQLGLYSVLAIAITLTIFSHGVPARNDKIVTLLICTLGTALVGLSMCRAAVLSLVLLTTICCISRQRKKLAPFVLCLVLSFSLVGALRFGAWSHRTQSSLAGAETAGSGRMALTRQAIAIWRLSPVFGVGPAGYLDTKDSHPEIKALSSESAVVHNIWLFILATLGAIGAGTFGWLWFEILRRCRHGGTLAVGLLVVVAPLTMLDYALVTESGSLWLGVTIGVALGLSERQPETAEQGHQFDAAATPTDRFQTFDE
jgi:hypothetical protein